MLNENTLVTTCSKIYAIDSKEIYSVHIEDRADINKYVYCDIMMPKMEIYEFSGFTSEQLEELKLFCQSHISLLEEMAKEMGYGDPSELEA